MTDGPEYMTKMVGKRINCKALQKSSFLELKCQRAWDLVCIIGKLVQMMILVGFVWFVALCASQSYDHDETVS